MAIQVAFVSTSVPRRCGIATFTSDLMAATRAADPSLIARVAAIDEPNVVRLYGHDVRCGAVDSRAEPGRGRHGRSGGGTASVGLRATDATQGHPTWDAGDRAAWPNSIQGEVGPRGPDHSLHLRPRGSSKGTRVHGAGNAGDRRKAP